MLELAPLKRSWATFCRNCSAALRLATLPLSCAYRWELSHRVAAAASVMAWIQTKRFQELAASYTLTAHEIGLLRIALPTPPAEDKFSVYVGDAENAFSREHTQWQARRDAD
ncbi:SLATT domain-containing protein [Paraburkholderia sp. UCT31]|nr:SLATT domain-containing protein [Paraburkholderia sp. UCT31]